MKAFLSIFLFVAFSPFVNADVSETTDQASQIRYYLPEPLRIFSKYMLDVSGKTEQEKIQSFNDAIETVVRWNNRKSQLETASSLQEYIQKRYQNRETYTNLNFEMDHLNRGLALEKNRFSFTSRKVYDEVRAYHRNQLEFAKKVFAELNKNHLSSEVHQQAGIKSLAESYYGNFLEAFIQFEVEPAKRKSKMAIYLNYLKGLPNDKKIEIANSFETGFVGLENELRNIGNRIASDPKKFETQVAEVKGMGRFVQLLLGGVFSNLSKVGAKNMISGMLDSPDQRNDQERFQLVLGYGVPQLLKLLQLVARMEGMDDQMKASFQKLESSGRAAPLALVKEVLEKEKEFLAKKNIKIIEIQKAFHAGTIAQMHMVKLEIQKEDGSKEIKEAALRLIKPGMMEKIARGNINMEATAEMIDKDEKLRQVNWPKLKPSVQAMGNNIYADADTKGASERQIQGKKYYSHSVSLDLKDEHRVNVFGLKAFPKSRKKLHIHYVAPEIYYYSDPSISGSGIMLMELVKGKKLEEVREKDPLIAKEIARGLMHRWVSEAFIRSGFIHADLHFGNFMADIYERVSLKRNLWYQVTSSSKEEMHIRVPIIDFGMGGIIDTDFRKAFVSLVVAGKLGNPEGMKEILWNLSIEEKTKINKAEFNRAFDAKFFEQKSLKKEDIMRSKDWVIWSIDKGLAFPEQFVSLSRGSAIVLLMAVRYELAQKLTGMMKSAVWNSPQLMNDAIDKGLIDWGLVKSSLGKKLHAGVSRAKNACHMSFMK